MWFRPSLFLPLLVACAAPAASPPIDPIERSERAERTREIANVSAPSSDRSTHAPPTPSAPCFRRVEETCFATPTAACAAAGCGASCGPVNAYTEPIMDCGEHGIARPPDDRANLGCVRFVEQRCYTDRAAACAATRCPHDVHHYCAEVDGDSALVYCADGGW
jgi:hypothetical protein